MEVGGLPLHPLVVHLVVVFVPLAAVSGWALALLPSWRWLLRWVALAAAAGALVAVFVARLSGEDLLEARPFLTSEQSSVRDTLELHQSRADVLTVIVVALAVTVVVAFVLLPAPTGLASGRMGHAGRDDRRLVLALIVLLMVLGALAIVWAVLTGDAGARAVWAT
jgi:hypothetical protein